MTKPIFIRLGAAKYINQIRNQAKKEYAWLYLDSLQRGTPAPEPKGLSYMAAQAVRMRLSELPIAS